MAGSDFDFENVRMQLIRTSALRPLPVGKDEIINTDSSHDEHRSRLKYFDAAHMLADSNEPRSRAAGIWAIANCLLASESHIFPDQSELTQRECYLEAIRLCPSFGDVYNDLAVSLSADETLQLPDGRWLNSIELYLEAIHKSDVACSKSQALANLSAHVDLGASVVLLDSRKLTKQELLLEALSFDEYPGNFIKLSRTLALGEKVTIPNGDEFDKLGLIMHAITLDPSNPRAYLAIGETMERWQVVTLPCGRQLNGLETYLEAIRLEPSFATAYNSLAIALYDEETIVLPDGRCMSQIDLLVEAQRLSPSNAQFYANIAFYLGDEEPITLADGSTLLPYQLLSSALACRPSSRDFYRRLCRCMPLNVAWTRQTSGLAFRGATSLLFGTLLLGLQRLETAGVLPLAHYSMLEEMLEGWTWADQQDLEPVGEETDDDDV